MDDRNAVWGDVRQASAASIPTRPPRGTGGFSQTTNRVADGIFGWYRYIQNFTGEFAVEWLSRLARRDDVIWEPFSGSGTTLVASKLLGLKSYGYDISPFMVDVASVKVDWTVDPEEIGIAIERVLGWVPGDTNRLSPN